MAAQGAGAAGAPATAFARVMWDTGVVIMPDGRQCEMLTHSGVMHCTTILNGFFTQEVQGVPLVDWLRAMLGGALPQEWRLLDDLAGSAGNSSALPADEDEWGEEAQRMLCAARFIATVGEAWKGNLTDSNAHLYVRQFHSACPGFPEH